MGQYRGAPRFCDHDEPHDGSEAWGGSLSSCLSVICERSGALVNYKNRPAPTHAKTSHTWVAFIVVAAVGRSRFTRVDTRKFIASLSF